jgi:hypothetical protein
MSLQWRMRNISIRINGTLGDVTTVDYSPTSACPTTAFPENYCIVTSIAQANGKTGPHALSAASILAYENGADGFTSREFHGFGKVTETRPAGSKVAYIFHRDDAKKDREQNYAIFDAQNAPYHAIA